MYPLVEVSNTGRTWMRRRVPSRAFLVGDLPVGESQK